MPDAALSQADIDVLAAAQASREQPQALFAAIEKIGARMVGQCLFSVNAFRAATQEVERLYSSNPDAYPVGGRKQKKATAWGQQVLIERRMFIGEDDVAIQTYFNDAALMSSLGVRSIINVPVVWRDACLGVLNFACPLPVVEARQVTAARLLALTAIAGFLESTHAF
jgi:GAF domain-containing protein